MIRNFSTLAPPALSPTLDKGRVGKRLRLGRDGAGRSLRQCLPDVCFFINFQAVSETPQGGIGGHGSLAGRTFARPGRNGGAAHSVFITGHHDVHDFLSWWGLGKKLDQSAVCINGTLVLIATALESILWGLAIPSHNISHGQPEAEAEEKEGAAGPGLKRSWQRVEPLDAIAPKKLWIAKTVVIAAQTTSAPPQMSSFLALGDSLKIP